MVKMMFMVYRKPDLTREQCCAEWTGDQHMALVHKLGGLKRYIQNVGTGEQPSGAPDGVGELWFDDAAAMDQMLASTAWDDASEDSLRFIDPTRAYALTVDETLRIG